MTFSEVLIFFKYYTKRIYKKENPKGFFKEKNFQVLSYELSAGRLYPPPLEAEDLIDQNNWFKTIHFSGIVIFFRWDSELVVDGKNSDLSKPIDKNLI